MKLFLVVALAITAVMGLPAAEPAAESAAAPELDPREVEFANSLEARKELEGRQGGSCTYSVSSFFLCIVCLWSRSTYR
jgi:hypothetical protein